ncbi:hypothetical protein NL676_007062 [Syzygium grande]|nr:hypothetical protein NL676_007062 [Syzygium grande]
MGELKGLSRWRSHYLGIGLDETLVDNAVEKAGMLLVQVEGFMRVLSSVVQPLASETYKAADVRANEVVVVFLKFLYDQDPVMPLLVLSEADEEIDIDLVLKKWLWLDRGTRPVKSGFPAEMDPILHLEMENEKLRGIPHTVVPPLSVSASRGVACVLAARMQALVYILDEDEDEISDSEGRFVQEFVVVMLVSFQWLNLLRLEAADISAFVEEEDGVKARGFILLSTAFPEDLSVNVDKRPCERGSTAPLRMLFVGDSAFKAL